MSEKRIYQKFAESKFPIAKPEVQTFLFVRKIMNTIATNTVFSYYAFKRFIK